MVRILAILLYAASIIVSGCTGKVVVPIAGGCNIEAAAVAAVGPGVGPGVVGGLAAVAALAGCKFVARCGCGVVDCSLSWTAAWSWL